MKISVPRVLSGRILRFALFAALVIQAAAGRRDPLKLDPANPHYLFFRGHTAVLVTSGEHYGAVIDSCFDYRAYLAELRRNHLNLTRVFVGSYLEVDKPHDAVKGGYTIDRNTLAPRFLPVCRAVGKNWKQVRLIPVESLVLFSAA